MIELRTWPAEKVEWGTTSCETRCGSTADGLLDGVPLCVLCAGVVVERWQIMVEYGAEAIARLPAIFRRDEERGIR